MTANPVIIEQLEQLQRLRSEHPFWRCRLLAACDDGTLSRDDFRYVFSQYQLYSKTFTRFLSALMTSCESDLFRSLLSKNLWEEGGGADPDQRHAELFRRFLRDSLDLPAPDETDYEAGTRHFVAQYLAFCTNSSAMAASAFLSLGTESIVPRLYERLIAGLERAGIPRSELGFFEIHIACDDEHAETLEQLMLSYAGDPSWFETCRGALVRALDLRLAFFEHLAEGVRRNRLRPIINGIDERRSLSPQNAASLRVRASDPTPALYTNRVDAEGIDFSVTRIAVPTEVLDPRRVLVPPGKRNELHRHAHETFLYFLEGTGRVLVDDHLLEVGPGDSVLVPRWALHQTQNTGERPLSFVAVTDYRLTDRAFWGDAKAYRSNEAANHHREEPASVAPRSE